MRSLAILVLASGCKQLLGFDELASGDAAPSDDSQLTDGAPIDDPPGASCYGTAPMRPCFPSPPTGAMTIVALDTQDACPETTILDGQPTCVVAAATITISGQVRVEGKLPLVLVGTDSITIGNGSTLDVSSSILTNARLGAGAQPSVCQSSMSGLTVTDGAAGGSFASAGGAGGASEAGGNGGIAASPTPQIRFRGGCRGAETNGRSGGPGGGAVYLISEAISINGPISAGGGGAEGGDPSLGGAGGGTGGYIGIDAPSVSFGSSGLVVATGGGGGSGGCMGQQGTNGSDSTSVMPAASGGNAPAGSGDGGDGAFNSNQSGEAGNSATDLDCGGGGGGGGLGSVQFFRGTSCPAGRCLPQAVSNP